MKNKLISRIGVALFVFLFATLIKPLTVSADDIALSHLKSDIILVVDVSGSMFESDTNRSFSDALRLGVDLAPVNSRIGVVAVGSTVASEFPLTDVSTSEGRAETKKYIDSLQKEGNTNFITGFERAAEMLEVSDASQKRIIFIGDFKEGGLNTADSVSNTVDAISSFSNKMKEQGIQVDMMLTGQAPTDSITAPQYVAIPDTTGGKLYEITTPKGFPAAVEELYFNNYTYFKSAYTLQGDSSQTMQITMPASHAQRSRIYVSASNPPASFSANYAGAALDGETTKAYSILYLDKPSQENLHINLTPGSTGTAHIYMILEYDIKLSVSNDNETYLPEKTKEYIQDSVIRAEIVDSHTNEPIVGTPFPDNAKYSVSIIKPDGQALTDYISNDGVSFRFSPKDESDFGQYTVSAKMTIGDFVFDPPSKSIQIDDVRPIVEPINWPLYLAIATAGLLILSALIFAFRHKKKEAVHQGAVEMASDYRFHGKLSLYAVMIDGGNREIPPFDIGMSSIIEKRITLREILDSGRAIGEYPGAENILILVGPEESLIIRNNSQAIIRVMGREYGYQTKLQVFYGQKIYIIFQQDENELEITYRQTREEAATPVRFHMQSK